MGIIKGNEVIPHLEALVKRSSPQFGGISERQHLNQYDFVIRGVGKDVDYYVLDAVEYTPFTNCPDYVSFLRTCHAHLKPDIEKVYQVSSKAPRWTGPAQRQMHKEDTFVALGHVLAAGVGVCVEFSILTQLWAQKKGVKSFIILGDQAQTYACEHTFNIFEHNGRAFIIDSAQPIFRRSIIPYDVEIKQILEDGELVIDQINGEERTYRLHGPPGRTFKKKRRVS